MEAAGGHWRTQIETARLVDRWPTAPRGHDEPRLAGIILDALDFADQAGAAIIYDLLESGIAVPLCCRKRDGGAAGPSQEIGLARPARHANIEPLGRSEERRGGKEGVRTGR